MADTEALFDAGYGHSLNAANLDPDGRIHRDVFERFCKLLLPVSPLPLLRLRLRLLLRFAAAVNAAAAAATCVTAAAAASAGCFCRLLPAIE